jgi:UPF0042 nucleotide-binding protein
MAALEVVSFGFLHRTVPAAHLTVDLRTHFRDPHITPGLRGMTARDASVRRTVLGTPGIRELIDALAAAVVAYTAGAPGCQVRVAVGCAGGRHRSAVVATELAARATKDGHGHVRLHHLDLDKPVVDR